MRWLRFTWSAVANFLYLFGLQDINQGWAFLQEQVICYLVTCVSGSKFDKVFLALLHRVGKVLHCSVPAFMFDCRILTYLIPHFITTNHWKIEISPNTEITRATVDHIVFFQNSPLQLNMP